MYARLGNHDAIERPHGLASSTAKSSGETRDAGAPVALEGKQVTTVNFPEDTTLIEAFTTITAAGGVWAQHSTGTPKWVESDNEQLAELIAANYKGCKVRKAGDSE